MAVAASAAYVVLATVVSVLGSPDTLVDFVVFYLLLAMCWVLGAYVRQRRIDEADGGGWRPPPPRPNGRASRANCTTW